MDSQVQLLQQYPVSELPWKKWGVQYRFAGFTVSKDVALVYIQVQTQVLNAPNNCKSFRFCDAIFSLVGLHFVASIGSGMCSTIWVLLYQNCFKADPRGVCLQYEF